MPAPANASTVLRPGDTQEVELSSRMDNCPDLCADCAVLSWAAHESGKRTDPGWPGLVWPRLTVASLGAANAYGHPHPETLTLLSRMRIPHLRTDRDGSLRRATLSIRGRPTRVDDIGTNTDRK
jgi:competence protein ComEC